MSTRVLSLTTVFPRPDEPRLGLFVRNRLAKLSELLEVRVVSPVAWLDTSGKHIRLAGLTGPRARTEGQLEVLHPGWFYPPGLGALHGYFLAASLERPLARLRKEFPFEIIDAHFGHPEGVAARRLARRFGCPYTVTLRGNETFHGAAGRKRELMSEALREAAAVIGVSKRLRDFAVELGADPATAHVIPNGVDGDVFQPRDREAARQRLGMTGDRRHILSAGYLIERKGHHRIARALPALHAAGIPAELWIVGDAGREGDFEPRIREAAQQAGVEKSVHFVAGVPPRELSEYFSACDVFCLASSREGWPNVVNEALACGAPVVASDVGGVPEMLPGREYGIAVPPADEAALADGLRRALTGDWSRTAIARWGAARSWAAVARETAEVLRAAVERGGSGQRHQ